MNKKLIIIIAAAIAVVAALIVGIVLIGGSIDGQRPDESDTSGTSSISSGTNDSTDKDSDSSTDSTSSVIQEGNVGIGKVESSKGKTVEVPITMSKNPGIVAGQFIFEYDSSALTYVEYKEGKLFDEYDVNDMGGKLNCIISASDVSKDVTENGDIIVLCFKVKDDAKKGDYTIKLGDKSMICNADEVVVAPTIADGKITVK